MTTQKVANASIRTSHPKLEKTSRRQFIVGSCGTLAGLFAFAATAHAHKPEPIRRLGFVHTHTGEKLDAVYWEQGEYLPDALDEISRVLRDHRTGETHPLDVELLDTLALLGNQLELRQSYHVISAYRSPKTNEMLRKKGSGVATKSMHMDGRAIDVRVPGVELKVLHRAALNLRSGGVGYYPRSEFVHLDTGRVRNW
jgi:uncharacterized protein YcbK (DUF882 family)